MQIKASLFHAKSATVMRLSGDQDALNFKSEVGEFTLFVPPHVADATAAAFNRAMQAVPTDRGGFIYQGSDLWNIENDVYRGWHGWSDEITGAGDPAWMFADASSLLELLDVIDAQEAENGCGRCAAIPGLDNLHEIGRGRDMEMICQDCFDAEGKRQQEMHEAALDDKAHALAERASA